MEKQIDLRNAVSLLGFEICWLWNPSLSAQSPKCSDLHHSTIPSGGCIIAFLRKDERPRLGAHIFVDRAGMLIIPAIARLEEPTHYLTGWMLVAIGAP